MNPLRTLDEQLMLLKLAGNMLMNEHSDQRWALHTQWVLDTQNSVRQGKVLPEYPTMPEAPTQDTMFEKAQRLETLLFCETVNSQNLASAEPPNSAEVEATEKTPEDVSPVVASEAVQESIATPDKIPAQATEPEIKTQELENKETKDDQPIDSVPAVVHTLEEGVLADQTPSPPRATANVSKWLWLTKRTKNQE